MKVETFALGAAHIDPPTMQFNDLRHEIEADPGSRNALCRAGTEKPFADECGFVGGDAHTAILDTDLQIEPAAVSRRAAEAFTRTRLSVDWGRAFGTLPAHAKRIAVMIEADG